MPWCQDGYVYRAVLTPSCQLFLLPITFYIYIDVRYWAPNGLFLPVLPEEPTSGDTSTNQTTSPTNNVPVLDMECVKNSFIRHLDAIDISTAAEKWQDGKSKRVAVVVVLAAKPVALTKFQRYTKYVVLNRICFCQYIYIYERIMTYRIPSLLVYLCNITNICM